MPRLVQAAHIMPKEAGGSADGKAKPSTTTNNSQSSAQTQHASLINGSTKSFMNSAFGNQSKPPPPQSTSPISRRPENPRVVLHKDIGDNSRSVSSVSESQRTSSAAPSMGVSSDVVRLVGAPQQQKHNDKNNTNTATNNALSVKQQQQQQQAPQEKRINGSTDFANNAQKSNKTFLDSSRHDKSADGIAVIKVKPRVSNHESSSSSSPNNAAAQTKIVQKEVLIQSSSRAANSDDQIIEKSSTTASRPERRHNGVGGDLQNHHHEVDSGAPSLGSLDAADCNNVTSPAAQSVTPNMPSENTTTVPIGDVAVPRNSELNYREKTEESVMAKNLPSTEVPKNDNYSARMASAQLAIFGAKETATVPNKQSSPHQLPISVFQSTETQSKKSVDEEDASDDDDEPLSRLKSSTSSSSKMKNAEEADSSTIKRLGVTHKTSASSGEGSKSTKPVTRKVPCPLCGQFFTPAGVVKHAATCNLPSSSRYKNKGNKRHRNSSTSSKDGSYRKRSKQNKPPSNDASTSGDDVAARGKDMCSGSQSSEGKVYRTVTQKDLDKADAAIQNAFKLKKNGPKIEWVRETFPSNESDILPPTEKPYASAKDAKKFYSDVLAQCGTARALKVLNIIKMSRDGKGNALVLISRMKSAIADKENLLKEFCYNFLPEIDIDRIYRSIPKATMDEPNMDAFGLSRTTLTATWKEGGSRGQRREKVVFVRASPTSSGRFEIDLTED